MTKAKPKPEPKPEWEPYGDDGKGSCVLQRRTRAPYLCRWVHRTTGEQIGPTQRNVAPALAWALCHVEHGISV